MLLFAMLACAAPPEGGGPDHQVLSGGVVVGRGVTDIEVAGGVIVAVGDVDTTVPVVDVSGLFIVPAFIDSHVHVV